MVVLAQEWSWEENKLFEVALAAVDEEEPRRWEIVAAMIGGRKSKEDVEEHFANLLQDIQVIESGQLDHKIEEYVISAYSHSICWSRGFYSDVTSPLAGQICTNCQRYFPAGKNMLLNHEIGNIT